MYIHELSSGKRLASLPLYIGSIVGFSGRKKDTEVYLLVSATCIFTALFD